MKKLIFLVVFAALAISCNKMKGVQGSGNLKTETRNVTGFKEIKAAGAVEFEVSFKPEYSVTVETDDNLLQYVTTETKGDALVINNGDSFNTKNKIKVKISMPELKYLELSGACVGKIPGVKGEKLRLELSGASQVKIDGEVKELNARASGACQIDAENLKTENADADASGASSITVNASSELKAEASGASKVFYVGDPKQLKQNASGVSSVQKK